MFYNKVIRECKKIWKNGLSSQAEKEKRLTQYFIENEKECNIEKVNKLIKKLDKKGIPTQSIKVWNETR